MRGVGPGTIKALRILKKHDGMHPREFARFMWPDSPQWGVRLGSGGARGRGMFKAGGSFLGKLSKLGLVYPDFYRDAGWRISALGRRVLEEAENS